MNSQLNQHAAWMRSMQAHIQAGNITPANARLAFQRFHHEHLQRQRQQQQQSQQRRYQHQQPQYQSQCSTAGSNFSGQPSGQQLPHPSSNGALPGQQFPRSSNSNNMRFPTSNMAQQCALNHTQSNLNSSGYVTPGIDFGAMIPFLWETTQVISCLPPVALLARIQGNLKARTAIAEQIVRRCLISKHSQTQTLNNNPGR